MVIINALHYSPMNSPEEPKIVTLALQGGGSHGAFTWGVLDRLLEDGRLEFEGISAASGGAMNAAVLAHGVMTGGREGARQALKDFWESVSTREPFNKISNGASSAITAGSNADPAYAVKASLYLARFFSPYQLNPFNLNPLRDILQKQLDFERLRAECRTELFIGATHLSTGTLRIFRNNELTLDVLLASACIPTLHHIIMIDGEAYWDGGLTANSPVFPLIYQCASRDVVMTILHPWRRADTPTTSDDIWHRLTEIGFSSAFFMELHGLALAKQEVERGRFSFGRMDRRVRSLNMHLIDAQEPA